MIIKEIYYINLFYEPDISKNKKDVYDTPRKFFADDQWRSYTRIIKPTLPTLPLILPKYDYKKLIKIHNNEKHNHLVEGRYAFSRKWFEDENNKRIAQKILANMIGNCIKKSEEVMWLTFEHVYPAIKIKGSVKKCIYHHINSNATFLIYLEYEPELNRLLTLILNSAIQYNKQITVYIPNVWIRKEFSNWLEKQ